MSDFNQRVQRIIDEANRRRAVREQVDLPKHPAVVDVVEDADGRQVIRVKFGRRL